MHLLYWFHLSAVGHQPHHMLVYLASLHWWQIGRLSQRPSIQVSESASLLNRHALYRSATTMDTELLLLSFIICQVNKSMTQLFLIYYSTM